MRLLIAASVLWLCAGCLTPRSVALGNTAAALGPGTHEVAVTTGFAWQTETTAPVDVETNTGITRTYTTAAGIQFPAAEANVQFGLTKLFGLNFHLSPAGIQPGLKMTLLDRGVTLGILPELGFGWANGATQATVFNNQTRTDADPSFNNRFILNAGARVLVSHKASGAYGGVGYQLLAFTQRGTTQTVNAQNNPITVTSSQTDTLHNILAAVGYELRTGSLRIRPELAISFTPERSTAVSQDGGAAISRSGGNAFFLFPNVTFAIEGKPGASRESEEGADEDEARERRREDGEGGDEGDEDELDENARVKPKAKAKPKSKEEEEETPPTRRSTSKIQSDDDKKPPPPKEEESDDSSSDSESE